MSVKKIIELEDRLTDVDMRLRAVEVEESPDSDLHAELDTLMAKIDGLHKRLDEIEMKVNLARPGKKTQR